MKNKRVKQMLCTIERERYGKCSKSTYFKHERGAVWRVRFVDGMGWLSSKVSGRLFKADIVSIVSINGIGRDK